MKSAPSWAALTLWLTALAATPVLASLDETLAAADLARGEKLFKKCAACHTINSGGKKKAGPNLYGIVGKPVATTEGFKYSTALKAYGGNWDVARLDAFLTKPKAEVKGTRMGFSGLKKPEDRINLIAFLDSNSDVQVSADQEQAKVVPEQVDEAPEFGLLIEVAGVENTYYTCSACHSEMIVAQQGLTRDGWDELIEWMVEEQGMSELDEPDLTEILDYLAANYNIDRPNFPNHQDRARRQVVED
jgi:cytochrome c